jgi:hypothetical protein
MMTMLPKSRVERSTLLGIDSEWRISIVVPGARREPDAPGPLLLRGNGQREHQQREKHCRCTAKKGD